MKYQKSEVQPWTVNSSRLSNNSFEWCWTKNDWLSQISKHVPLQQTPRSLCDDIYMKKCMRYSKVFTISSPNRKKHTLEENCITHASACLQKWPSCKLQNCHAIQICLNHLEWNRKAFFLTIQVENLNSYCNNFKGLFINIWMAMSSGLLELDSQFLKKFY